MVIDHTTQDFAQVLSGYDLVLNSQDARTPDKSLGVLRPGGRIISISGPPDPDFARQLDLGPLLKMVMALLSRRVRKKARRLGITYSFLFMRAVGQQLGHITALIESGAIRPVIDKLFPFGQTAGALAHVEAGHARGKVVIRVADQDLPPHMPALAMSALP